MPSLLELVTSLLGKGDTFDKLGGLIGGDADQAKAASEMAAPAILGGLAARAQSDSGLDTVMGMLDDNDSVLDDLGGFLDGGQAEAGNGVLDAVFGDGRADMVSSLASKADVGSSLMGKLLPMLAPIVMGVIGKRRADDGLDAAAVGTLLAGERESLESEGLFEGVPAKMAGAAAAVVGGAAMLGSAAKDKLDGATGAAGDAADTAVGAAGDGAAAIGDKASDVGDAAAGAVEGAADTAGETVEGAAAAATDTAKGAAGAAGDAAKGAAGAAAGVGDKIGDKLSDAGVKGPGDGSGDGTGAFGWLWWALGAVVLVLLLAWILSTCNDETVESSGDEDAAVTADADGDADGDANDSVDTDDADDADGDDADEVEVDDEADADLQAAVDAALDGTGITGTVAGGVVTLTGSVDDANLGPEAEEAIAALDGVRSVENEVEVAGASGDDDSTGGSDDESDADSDADVDASAGDTINELIDLDPVTFRVSSARITADGERVAITGARLNYQRHGDGGCANTNSSVDTSIPGGGFVQRSNTERTNPTGQRLDLP